MMLPYQSCGRDRRVGRLSQEELALAGQWFGRRVNDSAALLPRSANCACMSSFESRSQVRAARPAHLECAIRLRCEHSTAPFFASFMHTRQLTASTGTISTEGQSSNSGKTLRLLKVVLTKVCVFQRGLHRFVGLQEELVMRCQRKTDDPASWTTSTCRHRMHIAGPENRARDSPSSVGQRCFCKSTLIR